MSVATARGSSRTATLCLPRGHGTGMPCVGLRVIAFTCWSGQSWASGDLRGLPSSLLPRTQRPRSPSGLSWPQPEHLRSPSSQLSPAGQLQALGQSLASIACSEEEGPSASRAQGCGSSVSPRTARELWPCPDNWLALWPWAGPSHVRPHFPPLSHPPGIQGPGQTSLADIPTLARAGLRAGPA